MDLAKGPERAIKEEYNDKNPIRYKTVSDSFVNKSFKAISLGSILVSALALTSCSTTDEKAYQERSVEELYNEAMDKLEEREYTRASEAFDEVERQHPYSPWATKAQIMAAFSLYKGQKYDQVIASLESFSQLHPAHPDVPYALYMTGLCYYEQIGPSSRDQKDAEDSLRTFNELLRRFPNTAYAIDAKQKIVLLKDALAGKSMDIGRYYLDKKAFQAALPRFQEVVTRFQTTKHVEEAHYRMVECYVGMGLREQALKTAAVLGHNYLGSSWYAEAYSLVDAEKASNFDAKVPTSEGVGALEGREETTMDRLRNWNKGPLKKKPKIEKPKAEEGDPIQLDPQTDAEIAADEEAYS
ncbi:MAG TPA: outer membrane protein assembly factor BamD [Holosporales bacterium]|nr:outer membrane protein assembly factor BamD [Holosporales bacterium]